jgi:hypothetical protein
MENIAQDVVARPVSTTLTSSVAPTSAAVVTRPVKPESGQDSRGGDSQGRSWEQADARRPLTFQDALLSSTTLSSLRETLDRLSGDRFSTTENRSISRATTGKDGEQGESGAVSFFAQGEASGDDPRTVVQSQKQSRDGNDQSSADSNGGDGYYGPDWNASGQLLDASRRAVAVYQQSTASMPNSPYATRAEVLDMVA